MTNEKQGLFQTSGKMPYNYSVHFISSRISGVNFLNSNNDINERSPTLGGTFSESCFVNFSERISISARS